jgi:hypothetical protein
VSGYDTDIWSYNSHPYYTNYDADLSGRLTPAHYPSPVPLVPIYSWSQYPSRANTPQLFEDSIRTLDEGPRPPRLPPKITLIIRLEALATEVAELALSAPENPAPGPVRGNIYETAGDIVSPSRDITPRPQPPLPLVEETPPIQERPRTLQRRNTL